MLIINAQLFTHEPIIIVHWLLMYMYEKNVTNDKFLRIYHVVGEYKSLYPCSKPLIFFWLGTNHQPFYVVSFPLKKMQRSHSINHSIQDKNALRTGLECQLQVNIVLGYSIVQWSDGL